MNRPSGRKNKRRTHARRIRGVIPPHCIYRLISKTKQCPMCKGQHLLGDCLEFRGMTTSTRWNHAKECRLCRNCLQDTHHRRKCPSKGRCRECDEAHHTLLHTAPSSDGQKEPATFPVVLHTTRVSTSRRMLLATARVRLQTAGGRSTVVCALIDQGSEVNLVTEIVAQRLQALRRATRLQLTGVSEE